VMNATLDLIVGVSVIPMMEPVVSA
jgi:hypothetical protein